MPRLYEPLAYDDAARADCAFGIARDWPRLGGEARSEVAIIGAGYTGLSAALVLAEAGVSVTLLEAKAPGWGASGRNGGFCCLGGSIHDDATLARRFGRDAADDWLHAQRAAIDLVEARLDRFGIDASRHSEGEVQLAHRPWVFDGYRTAGALYARAGIETEVLPPEALAERGLRAAGLHGGLHVKAGFGLDPGAYAMGLARAAQAAGAVIHGESPVTAIAPVPEGFALTTPGGRLVARRLLIATNGYSAENLPPWLAGRTLPLPSSVFVTRPITPAEQAEQGWTSDLMAYDSRALLHYFRLMPDGRFLFGMRGGTRATPEAFARIHAQAKADFAALFPAWAGVEVAHRWSGLVNLTRHGTPYVGPVPGMAGAFVAMGYHGNGVAMASLAGEMAAGLLSDAAPARAVPAVMARPLGRFPLGRHRRLLLDVTTWLLALADRR